MKIGLCPSIKKYDAKIFIEPIAEYLTQGGASVYIDKDFEHLSSLPPIRLDSPIDIYMALGGDGTLLAYKHKYAHDEQALFTAVNLGTLGFMADVRISHYEAYLDDLLTKNFSVDERIMLQGTLPSGEIFHAVNDFVLHRGGIKNMIHLRIEIDGEYFNTFQSDGLIIATPTGSTAYSLAAGGPIMHPQLKSLVMTPIAAHTLTSRPFIAPQSSHISVEYLSSHGPIEVTFDGLHSFPLHLQEKLSLTISPRLFRLVSFDKRHSFYSILRDKLHWSGQTSR